MPTIAFIGQQIARERQRAKAKVEPDLTSIIRRAVADALAEAGITPRHKPPHSPPDLPRAWRWARPAPAFTAAGRVPPPRTEPLPLVVPPAAAAPRPLPQQLKVERHPARSPWAGLVKAVCAEPGGPTFSVQRDELGRIDLVLIDGKPHQRWLYGVDGETVVATVPADHPPTRYDGKAVGPATANKND